MSREKKTNEKDLDEVFAEVQTNSMVCVHDMVILMASIYEAVEKLGVNDIVAIGRAAPDSLVRGIGLFTWMDMREIAIGVGMSMNTIGTNDPIKGAQHFIDSGEGGINYVYKGIRTNIRELYVPKARAQHRKRRN